MIFKNQHGLCNFVWFPSTTRWKVSPKVGLRFTSDHPSFRVGHGRQGTWYQWSNQWLWGGNTMGYGVARCPCVVPDKTDGVCAYRIPRKKKKKRISHVKKKRPSQLLLKRVKILNSLYSLHYRAVFEYALL